MSRESVKCDGCGAVMNVRDAHNDYDDTDWCNRCWLSRALRKVDDEILKHEKKLQEVGNTITNMQLTRKKLVSRIAESSEGDAKNESDVIHFHGYT